MSQRTTVGNNLAPKRLYISTALSSPYGKASGPASGATRVTFPSNAIQGEGTPRRRIYSAALMRSGENKKAFVAARALNPAGLISNRTPSDRHSSSTLSPCHFPLFASHTARRPFLIKADARVMIINRRAPVWSIWRGECINTSMSSTRTGKWGPVVLSTPLAACGHYV